MFRSPDGSRDSFDIVAKVLQGDTSVLYLLILYLDNVVRTSINLIKENDFTLKKKTIKRYPSKSMSDAEYADDLVLLVNILAQAECQMYCIEQAVEDIGFNVTANKT